MVHGSRQQSGGRFSSVLIVVLLVGIVAIGLTSSIFVYQDAKQHLRLELLSRGRMVAKAINWRRLQTLNQWPEDQQSPDYLRIKEQLQMVASGDTNCRLVQLLGIQGRKIYCIANSDLPGSQKVWKPSSIHEQALLRVFDSGEEHVSGPLKRQGLSAHVAIAVQDPKDGSVTGVFYMEVDASGWHRACLIKAIVPILVALLFASVLWFCYILVVRSHAALRTIEKSQQALRQSEQRVRRKLDAMLNPEGDIGALDLADIIDVPAVQALMDEFSTVTKMTMAIVDLHGNVLVQSGWQEICMRFHRLNADTRKHCVESDTVLTEGIEPGQSRAYKCKNNLWDVATPIIVGGKHLANMFLGQFFYDDEPVDYELFAQQARRYGFDQEAYLAALAQVPRWNHEHVDAVIALYRGFSDLISKTSLSNINLARALSERDVLLESLHSSSKRFRTLVENIPGAVFRCECNAPWRVHYMSEGVYQLMGHTASDFIEERVYWSRMILDEDLPGVQQAVDQSIQQKKAYSIDYRVQHAQGEIRWVHESACCQFDENGQPLYLDGVILDITAQKQAEQTSQKNEQWLRSIFRAAPSGMGVVANRVFLDVNLRMCEMTGYSSEELVGHDTRLLYPTAEEYQHVGKDLYESLYSETAVMETRWRRKDGAIIYVLLSASSIGAEDPPHIAFVATDITSRKQAEAALLESEERFRRISELSSDMAYSCVRRQEKCALDWLMGACEHITGYTADEIKARGCWSFLVVEEDLAKFRENISDLPPGRSSSCELRLRHKADQIVWVSCQTECIVHPTLPETSIIYGGLVDITERKLADDERERLQTQLFQAQKMEAVGQLAGGVAHDFNNLLQVILGQIDLMMMSGVVDECDHSDLEDVKNAAERAVELTRQLLAFSRRQVIQPVNLDLNALIERVLTMIRRVIGEHIDLEFVPGSDLGVVRVDPGLMHQVVMNLCVNARDAMPQGGSLKLKTIAVDLDEAYCAEHPWASPGAYVQFSVTDTGVGMDEETRAQIFEPFFTTKEVGHGTGLGLATVYGIVKQHNGLIHVYSEPGMGTEFKVYIPSVQGPLDAIDRPALPAAEGGTETILVAEDELTVRNLVVKMLSSAGYTVLTAHDGQEALRVVKEHGGQISLAILDVVMPRMGGREVMELIHQQYPEIRFLFSSGYSEDGIHTKFVINEGLHLIQKPYLKPALLRTVRRVLDSPAG